jgi:hypothetical protein
MEELVLRLAAVAEVQRKQVKQIQARLEAQAEQAPMYLLLLLAQLCITALAVAVLQLAVLEALQAIQLAVMVLVLAQVVLRLQQITVAVAVEE